MWRFSISAKRGNTWRVVRTRGGFETEDDAKEAAEDEIETMSAGTQYRYFVESDGQEGEK